MANIKLDWSGATASTGIKGYEVSYKESTDSLWTSFPFITSTSSSGTYTWTGAEYFKDYNFRIRTQDNDNLYSIYKLVNLNTDLDNNPPDTFDSYLITFTESDSLSIDFFNASDDFGIKGHEVSYKRTVDSTYTTLPFITTSSTDISVTISSLLPNTDYDIRVRTQDIFDVWSLTYYNIEATTSTVVVDSIQRSLFNVQSGSGCGLEMSTNLLYYTGEIENDNILYVAADLATPFNGLNKVWLVYDGFVNFSVKISTVGVISKISIC